MTDHSGTAKVRPVHRNISVGDILSYRLPPAGIVSILHRISGVLLFVFGIPLMLYLLDLSLRSEISYQRFADLSGGVFFRLVVLVLLWGFFHHMCAGIRYLLLDIHVGVGKEQSRVSAFIVFGATAALTLIAALKLFGGF